MDDNYAVEMVEINKSFFNVQVLKNAQIRVKPGEVMALVGENGAGKSTLMNILCGVYSKDSGTVRISGKEVVIKNPMDAVSHGVAMIHQEICLVERMSVMDNVFLGCERKKNALVRDPATQRRLTQEALDTLHVGVYADDIVETLSVAQKQMVEVAKAICFDARIVVFDEPTAALSDVETHALFEQIRKFKSNGVAVIYISHRLEELFEIADKVTIMRDACFITQTDVQSVTRDDIIYYMVGRGIKTIYTKDDRNRGNDTILEVKNLKNQYLKDVSFTLKRGEVLGFAGLVGSGRTELARALFGADKVDSGKIILDGKECKLKKPSDAIKMGIMLASEDRKLFGLILRNTISFNLTLMVCEQFIKRLSINRKKETEIINGAINDFKIKTAGYEQLCINLSGGNQQKVVIAKCLTIGARLLILDEPTKGVDIGAKQEIYKIITKLAKEENISIIMISSEMSEILNLSSRIAVMCEGRLMAVLDNIDGTVNQEKIMHYAVGGE